MKNFLQTHNCDENMNFRKGKFLHHRLKIYDNKKQTLHCCYGDFSYSIRKHILISNKKEREINFFRQ